MKLLIFVLFLVLSLMYHTYALLPQSHGISLSAEQQNIIDNMMQDNKNQNPPTNPNGNALPENGSQEFFGSENTNTDITPQQQKSIQEFLDDKYGKITVLNQQSYPIVGEYWTTQFVTSGTHDLIITAINNTSFWGSSPDISFVELYNGNTKLVPLIIDNKIVFPNYSSDGTGYLKVKVHTTGAHNLKLEFGSSVAYTNNNAYPALVVEINDDTANGPTLSDDDTFGRSVANIGDLDRDGINDIAVGAFQDDAGGTNRGAIHIIFMNINGSPKSTVEINDDTANGPVLNNGDRFGTSVANIGDLNNDGINDIAVGAPYDDAGATDRGAIHIIFMNINGSPKSTVEINDDTANGPTLNNGDIFGTSVANIGDLNNDGINDIAVGAFQDDAGGTNRGAIHIIYLNAIMINSNGSVDSTVEINDDTTNGPVLSNDDYFGRSVANIGDLDRDGINDIAVGTPFDDTGGTDSGAIHIIFMNINGSPKSTVEINDDTANGPTLIDGDIFGYSVANIGDLNNDGINDIAVGAPYDDTGGTDRGAIHIIFMNINGSPKSTVVINDNTANGPVLNNGDRFGTSVANIGDLNNDGINDIAVGAPYDDAGATDRGAIHIIFMNINGSPKSTVEINDDTANGPVLNDEV